MDLTNLSGKSLGLARFIIIIFSAIVIVITVGVVVLICILLFAYNVDDLSAIINSQTVSSLGIFAMATLGVLLFTALLGICGSIRQSGCLLKLFAFILTILTMVEFAAACYYFAYSSEVDTFLKQEMASSMDHYVGENSTTADSIAWNFLQLKFDCCGIDSHEDWDVTSWKEADPSIGGYTQPYPYTCCTIENEPSLKNIKDGYVPPSDTDLENCYDTGTPGLHSKGCYSTVDELLSDYGFYVGAGIVALLSIQLLLIYLSCQISTKAQAKNSFSFSKRSPDDNNEK
ncbi:tetraspanin-18-like [Convolutriloba macropyga]|uniref:tetraspanin-18-like n=1 Tax=Convolutriloba macropyga TaxID=536237 RepID=UPI003F528308